MAEMKLLVFSIHFFAVLALSESKANTFEDHQHFGGQQQQKHQHYGTMSHPYNLRRPPHQPVNNNQRYMKPQEPRYVANKTLETYCDARDLRMFFPIYCNGWRKVGEKCPVQCGLDYTSDPFVCPAHFDDRDSSHVYFRECVATCKPDGTWDVPCACNAETLEWHVRGSDFDPSHYEWCYVGHVCTDIGCDKGLYVQTPIRCDKDEGFVGCCGCDPLDNEKGIFGGAEESEICGSLKIGETCNGATFCENHLTPLVEIQCTEVGLAADGKVIPKGGLELCGEEPEPVPEEIEDKCDPLDNSGDVYEGAQSGNLCGDLVHGEFCSSVNFCEQGLSPLLEIECTSIGLVSNGKVIPSDGLELCGCCESNICATLDFGEDRCSSLGSKTLPFGCTCQASGFSEDTTSFDKCSTRCCAGSTFTGDVVGLDIEFSCNDGTFECSVDEPFTAPCACVCECDDSLCTDPSDDGKRVCISDTENCSSQTVVDGECDELEREIGVCNNLSQGRGSCDGSCDIDFVCSDVDVFGADPQCEPTEYSETISASDDPLDGNVLVNCGEGKRLDCLIGCGEGGFFYAERGPGSSINDPVCTCKDAPTMCDAKTLCQDTGIPNCHPPEENMEFHVTPAPVPNSVLQCEKGFIPATSGCDIDCQSDGTFRSSILCQCLPDCRFNCGNFCDDPGAFDLCLPTGATSCDEVRPCMEEDTRAICDCDFGSSKCSGSCADSNICDAIDVSNMYSFEAFCDNSGEDGDSSIGDILGNQNFPNPCMGDAKLILNADCKVVCTTSGVWKAVDGQCECECNALALVREECEYVVEFEGDKPGIICIDITQCSAEFMEDENLDKPCGDNKIAAGIFIPESGCDAACDSTGICDVVGPNCNSDPEDNNPVFIGDVCSDGGNCNNMFECASGYNFAGTLECANGYWNCNTPPCCCVKDGE